MKFDERACIQKQEEAKAIAKAKAENDARIDEMVAKKRKEFEAAAIEERRKAAQLAESARMQGPSDKELIEFIAQNFDVSYGTACDWILETAESMKRSA